MKTINYENLSATFKSLAHPVRLRIVELLLNDECCVNDLSKLLGLPQSTTSQHLAILKRGGILSSYRAGTKTCFSIRDKTVIDLPGIFGK